MVILLGYSYISISPDYILLTILLIVRIPISSCVSIATLLSRFGDSRYSFNYFFHKNKSLPRDYHIISNLGFPVSINSFSIYMRAVWLSYKYIDQIYTPADKLEKVYWQFTLPSTSPSVIMIIFLYLNLSSSTVI